MKKILYLFVAGLLLLSACKSRKKQKETEVVKTEVVETAKEVTETTEVVIEKKKPTTKKKVIAISPEHEAGKVFVSLSKSMCFGVCPVYDFTLYKNGQATYEGKENVKRIGSYKAQMSSVEINSLLEGISSLGYFSLEDEYDNKSVTDLPSTITYLNFDGKEKQVLCRYECDKRAQDVNKMIESTIESINWIAVEK